MHLDLLHCELYHVSVKSNERRSYLNLPELGTELEDCLEPAQSSGKVTTFTNLLRVRSDNWDPHVPGSTKPTVITHVNSSGEESCEMVDCALELHKDHSGIMDCDLGHKLMSLLSKAGLKHKRSAYDNKSAAYKKENSFKDDKTSISVRFVPERH